MEELQHHLEQAGIWNDELRALVVPLWKYGVERIGDDKLRESVARFLGTVPLAFYVIPASTSGRFHPPWQHGRHGTLRSIVESCIEIPRWSRRVAGILNERMEPDPRMVDVAYAATLISDVWKKEDGRDKHYGDEHGRIAAEHWRPFALAEGLDATTVEDVADASVWHMGLYTPGATNKTVLSPVADLVNLADYSTSIKERALYCAGRTVIL